MEVVVAVEANLDVGTTRRTHPEPPAQVGKGSVERLGVAQPTPHHADHIL
jgi:hypothetical protein